MEVRSSKVLSLEVVNLSQRIGKSSFYAIVSRIESNFTLQTTATDVDTMSVVRDLKQLQPSILDDDLERSRASINSILYQFLQCMNRGDYDLACSNFVDNILIKSLGSPISCGSALSSFRTCYLDPFWSLAS